MAAQRPPTSAHRAQAPKRKYRTLAEGLRGHQNSFGALRLVLASMVIFSHAFYTGGWGEDPSLGWTNGQETIGGFAVVGFFAVSGYLIAKSGTATDVLQFVWRRVLRIFPAFWLVLLVAACVVGPIAWLSDGNSVATYVTTSPEGPLAYLKDNAQLSIGRYGIYDIFGATTPYGEFTGGASVFNGSLWTLEYEFRCYLVIALFVGLGLLRRARFVVPGTVGLIYLLAVADRFSPGFTASLSPYLADGQTIRLTLIFLIGASMAMYANRIILSDRLAIASALVATVTLFSDHWMYVGYPAFAYTLLWAAARLPESVQWIGAKNDYSYGMYVYGFLVQQLTAYWGWYRLGYWPWVFVTLVITAGFAWLSWHGVEKRALTLKNWGPGRGIRYWWQWRPGPRRMKRETRIEGTPTLVTSDAAT